MRLPIPESMCNQNVILTKIYQSETDDYNRPKKDKPVTITNCVVQLATQYTGTNENRQLIANGAVYFYAAVSSPFPELTKDNLGSVIEYDGQNYTLKTINEYHEPLSNELYGYKLEVL